MSDLRVGICAIAKDEASYLEEWIAYHHLMGFAPIRVYAHECTDQTHSVLMRMARSGLCEWAPFATPPKLKPQWAAYEDGLGQLRDRTDWLAFIDLDEYLVTPRHGSIQAFLAEYGHLGAIAVNWKIFGSAGHQAREPGLVIERFTRCSAREYRSNRMVKTVARTDAIAIPRVHTCHWQPGVVYQTVRGEVMGDHVGSSEHIDHDVIRVNHYFTKSAEEWEAKIARGRGAKRPSSPIKHRTDLDFEHHDRNEEQDTAALRWAAPVRQLIADINAANVAVVYDELETAQRRLQRLEADNERMRLALDLANSQRSTAMVALTAEADRASMLQDRMARAADAVARAGQSATWRIGARIVRVARLLTLRRTRGASALDVAERQLAPEASATSAASLTTQTTASGG